MSDNIFVLNESSSEYSTSSEENEDDNIVLNNEFMNYTPVQEYERNRNKLFTKDIEKRIIVVDSHNVHQTTSFKSSNYTIKFRNNNEDTNINVHNNVIGFRLLKANIRSPPFNVNSTNNVIPYTISGTEYSVTINPGLYTLSELANVFAFNYINGSNTYNLRAHHVTYSDTSRTDFTNVSGTSSRIEYLDSTASSSNGRGISFKFTHATNNFTIHWNKNNVSRGAAKLFGFFPEDIDSTTSPPYELYSNKIPDLSTHYVDLVIPEIPQIACKHNSYGNDIIERIPLTSFHGEYVYYKDDYDISVNYFFPIKLHELTIKLYSDNKELYDCNNSDNNFEFEITLVKNINLLK